MVMNFFALLFMVILSTEIGGTYGGSWEAYKVITGIAVLCLEHFNQMLYYVINESFFI